MSISFKKLLKPTAFVLIIIILFQIAVNIFTLRTIDIVGKQEFFQKTPKERVEVLLLGNSKMATEGNVETLWNEFGIPAFNYAGGAQTPWQAYYGVVEALKCQHPKVIVWEVSTFTAESAFGYEFPINVMTNFLPLSRNKIEYLREGEGLSLEATLEHIMVLPALHAKWEGLNRYDFESWAKPLDFPLTKGFLPWFAYADDGEDMTGESILAQVSIEEHSQLNAKAELYLIKMIELCQENGVELVLFLSPSVYDSSVHTKTERVRKIAEESGCLFLNGLEDYDEIGLNWSEDMSDGVHPNYNGSIKISSYLGKALRQEFSLADRRGDADYDYWNEDGRFFETNAELFWSKELKDIYKAI